MDIIKRERIGRFSVTFIWKKIWNYLWFQILSWYPACIPSRFLGEPGSWNVLIYCNTTEIVKVKNTFQLLWHVLQNTIFLLSCGVFQVLVHKLHKLLTDMIPYVKHLYIFSGSYGDIVEGTTFTYSMNTIFFMLGSYYCMFNNSYCW